MRVCLGMIARPVEELFVKCLGVVIDQFDGLVIVTSKNPTWRDGVTAMINPRCLDIFDDYVWKHDYGDARNQVIRHAEEIGYDWMFVLDPDESMLKEDCVTIRKYIELQGEECLIVPRYEFADDFDHFVPDLYPDAHPRAFQLKIGYHFEGTVHEPLWKGSIPAHALSSSTLIPMVHIFHYARCKVSKDVWLKSSAYHRVAQGLEPFKEVPPEIVLPKTWALDKKRVPFLGPKPL
jgi:hypothetical protein